MICGYRSAECGGVGQSAGGPGCGSPAVRARRRRPRGDRAAGRGAGCAGRALLTFAGLVCRDVLGPQPLVQDVKHLPAQVQEEQR